MPLPGGFDFAALKIRSRRAIHLAFGVAAVYTAPDGVTTFNCHVRWHMRQGTFRGGNEADDASFLTGLEKILFNEDELSLAVVDDNGVSWGGFVPARGGSVLIAQYPALLALDHRMPDDGPVTQDWSCVRGGDDNGS